MLPNLDPVVQQQRMSPLWQGNSRHANPSVTAQSAQPAEADPRAVIKAIGIAGPVANPATPEQQNALGAMGIASDRNVINHGAGVDYATANQIERQGRFGGKDGLFTQLKGYGDQNSLYGRASKPGGKINEFYGAGTGKASTPGSMGLNVIPAAAMMQPETRGPGLSERANIMERNIAAAEASGDWRAANAMRAELSALSEGPAQKQAGSPMQQMLADVMAMPVNSFGDMARKRAALSVLKQGISLQDVESRNALEQSKAGFIAQESGQRIEAGKLSLADQRRVSALRDQLVAETDPNKRAELTRQLNTLTNACRHGQRRRRFRHPHSPGRGHRHRSPGPAEEYLRRRHPQGRQSPRPFRGGPADAGPHPGQADR